MTMGAMRDPVDPKGLIAEAYKIDGISEPECRSIFLDWALSVEGDMRMALDSLLARAPAQEHPMTQVLRSGQTEAAAPRRRGGWRARNRG